MNSGYTHQNLEKVFYKEHLISNGGMKLNYLKDIFDSQLKIIKDGVEIENYEYSRCQI